jgi:hypothetical protein
MSWYILGSYDTLVVKFKRWQQKLLEIGHEYTEP